VILTEIDERLAAIAHPNFIALSTRDRQDGCTRQRLIEAAMRCFIREKQMITEGKVADDCGLEAVGSLKNT
jgi:hypothetical protein